VTNSNTLAKQFALLLAFADIPALTQARLVQDPANLPHLAKNPNLDPVTWDALFTVVAPVHDTLNGGFPNDYYSSLVALVARPLPPAPRTRVLLTPWEHSEMPTHVVSQALLPFLQLNELTEPALALLQDRSFPRAIQHHLVARYPGASLFQRAMLEYYDEDYALLAALPLSPDVLSNETLYGILQRSSTPNPAVLYHIFTHRPDLRSRAARSAPPGSLLHQYAISTHQYALSTNQQPASTTLTLTPYHAPKRLAPSSIALEISQRAAEVLDHDPRAWDAFLDFLPLISGGTTVGEVLGTLSSLLSSK
jgi:hypothetical protein